VTERYLKRVTPWNNFISKLYPENPKSAAEYGRMFGSLPFRLSTSCSITVDTSKFTSEGKVKHNIYAFTR
jgi:radical SAM superfamily enzyme with C-terminal helix-hairpin-helix motif